MYDHFWPKTKLYSLILALAKIKKWPVSDELNSVHASIEDTSENLDAFLIEDFLSSSSGLEVHSYDFTLKSFLNESKASTPLIIELQYVPGKVICITDINRKNCEILAPDGTLKKIKKNEILSTIFADIAEGTDSGLNQFLQSDIFKRSIKIGQLADLKELFDPQGRKIHAIGIKVSSDLSIWEQIKVMKMKRWLLYAFSGYALFYFLNILAYGLVGFTSYEEFGQFGYISMWSLCILLSIPLLMLTGYFQGNFVNFFSALMKRKIISQIRLLDAEQSKDIGMGLVLAYAAEAENFEQFSINGGLLFLFGLMEILLCLPLVFLAPSSGSLFVILVAVLLSLVLLCRLCYLVRKEWSMLRLRQTDKISQKFIGHDTRRMQEKPENYHIAEDDELVSYHQVSQRYDLLCNIIETYIPRLFLVCTLLLFCFILVDHSGGPELVFFLAASFLLYGAVSKLSSSLRQIIVAFDSYRLITQFIKKNALNDQPAPMHQYLILNAPKASVNAGFPLLEAHGLSYKVGKSRRSILKNLNLKIDEGQKILFSGKSGSGKSTLGFILAGMLKPEHGKIKYYGTDSSVYTSDSWQDKVIISPQYHENHVFAETFAFNLLMGRRWPARADDIELARQICEEIGLGELLNKMPSGMWQMVGEMGWQLSHGEKSRVFLARCLLQDADLLILDENLAALDPETIEEVRKCLVKRSKALILIEHL